MSSAPTWSRRCRQHHHGREDVVSTTMVAKMSRLLRKCSIFQWNDRGKEWYALITSRRRILLSVVVCLLHGQTLTGMGNQRIQKYGGIQQRPCCSWVLPPQTQLLHPICTHNPFSRGCPGVERQLQADMGYIGRCTAPIPHSVGLCWSFPSLLQVPIIHSLGSRSALKQSYAVREGVGWVVLAG